MRADSHTLIGAVILLISAVTVATSAFAQSGNPTLERCRNTVGRPIVLECMRSGQGNLESCRAKATPAVRRCMVANGGGPNRQSRGVAQTSADTGQDKLAILMPGAGGAAASDFLVRNKGRIAGAGISVVVTTSSGDAASLSQSASAKGRKVILVGMSRGAIDVAGALASGARANGVIFVSGPYDKVRSSLGSPSRLPRTLVVHHRRDQCRLTPASAVSSFVSWSKGRTAAIWIDNQGAAVPNPCGPRGAHGFFMQDGAAVSAINAFIGSH